MMKKRIGILNSGGDCPALNTVIDAIVKALDHDHEIIGFYRGFEGLLEKNYLLLDRNYTSQNRWIGGTILKTVNKGNFPSKRDNSAFDSVEMEVIEKAYSTYQELGLDALIVLGGDGTLFTAYQLQNFGFKIIGVPKSIDNDLNITDFTFGFHTAVEIANEAINRLHTTAASHDRVMILEVMGRTAGWIALYSGLAGGANMILLPEIPFKYNSIKEFLDFRANQQNTSSIIVVSEAASNVEGEYTYQNWDVKKGDSPRLGGIGEMLAKFINQETSYEARSVSLGHLQRGGSPIAYDKIIATQLGAYAANMYRNEEFGKMAAYKNNSIISADLSESVLELKLVPKNSQLIKLAKDIGISFGE
jgi:ATP-dependent phosphofructokinase / diphosphate-dependent phosphofructokinase